MELHRTVAPDAIKPCCPGMKYSLERAGKAGFAVVVIDAQTPFFALEFRSYPVQADAEYRRYFATECDAPKLILGTQDAIRYCPWCGRNLDRVLAQLQAGRLGFSGFLPSFFRRFG